ncbi:SanA/YdcF family protein [Brevibacillus dissolubilis]|uniref:SanA/YdcF family protein n=1 Tax=Brevibacillus dissolubilis TaxID=1844116 RepID=UPI0021000EA0|nr:ElyC/SanA/YdcF family protein [Brevibacillus dissolubilis]
MMRRKLRKGIFGLLACFVLTTAAALGVDAQVRSTGAAYMMSPEEVPEADAILVLGAKVYSDGRLSAIVKDRVDVAMELYTKDKADKLLVSGDHGRKEYDEVNAMRSYMEEHGIDGKDIFMDHAGFSTYESMYRAKEIFKVKKVIIVTQEYHLMRSLYVARQLGLEAYGVASDRQLYYGMKRNQLREIAARCKDYLFVHVFKPQPTYLGEAIPISGDGRKTRDDNKEKL